MTYMTGSSVQVSAWARVGANTEISYHVIPHADAAEFSLGGCGGLGLDMSEAGLRSCIAAFTEALDVFTAGETAQPDAIPSDQAVELEHPGNSGDRPPEQGIAEPATGQVGL